MYVYIEDPHNRLVKDVWRFYVPTGLTSDAIKVQLDEFVRYTRPSTRHRKWEMTGARYLRGGDSRREGRLMESAPVVPSYIQLQLLERIREAMVFEYKHDPTDES